MSSILTTVSQRTPNLIQLKHQATSRQAEMISAFQYFWCKSVINPHVVIQIRSSFLHLLVRCGSQKSSSKFWQSNRYRKT